jgi:hypothetical protein
MQSYGPPKLRESQLWEFQDSHLGVPGQNAIWMWSPWRSAKNTIKGRRWWLPQVRAVVSLMNPNCPWLILAPKVIQLCTNHLVLVLCRSMWVVEACQIFLVPSQSSNTPLYPSQVLRAKECAPPPCSSVIFCLELTFESLKELGARHICSISKFCFDVFSMSTSITTTLQSYIAHIWPWIDLTFWWNMKNYVYYHLSKFRLI